MKSKSPFISALERYNSLTGVQLEDALGNEAYMRGFWLSVLVNGGLESTTPEGESVVKPLRRQSLSQRTRLASAHGSVTGAAERARKIIDALAASSRPLSRQDLVEVTGLRSGSVCSAVYGLLSRGLICEAGIGLDKKTGRSVAVLALSEKVQ